jgi:hypothetical protein
LNEYLVLCKDHPEVIPALIHDMNRVSKQLRLLEKELRKLYFELRSSERDFRLFQSEIKEAVSEVEFNEALRLMVSV